MAIQATRRMVLLLVTALVVAAMMSVAVMAPTPAFAQGGSENSCGAANPNIDVPAHPGNKGEEFVPGACGFRNNQNYEPGEFPPGQFH
jgi:hypothetical protein